MLLTQVRPYHKHIKTHQSVRNAARQPCASKAWCILRMHCRKWVLHSLPVDAGAATPEKHQNTPTGQKCSEAYLHMKEWCILIQQVSRIQRNVCPFPSLLQRIIAGTHNAERARRAYMFLRKVHIQSGGKILHTCLGQSTSIRPLSVQEHLSGHRLRKEQALTREKCAKCAWG